MKKLAFAIALTVVAIAAQASGLSVVGGSAINITGYDGQPLTVTGAYTSGQSGQLSVSTAGVFSATYLGQESGFRDSYWMGPAYLLNESSAIGTTISRSVGTGVLDFWFTDSRRGRVGNDGSSNRNASFAILAGRSLGELGTFDYILGFNDSGAGLADFDDFVVGVRLTPDLVPTSHTPLPAAVWLFGSALAGFVVISNRRKV